MSRVELIFRYDGQGLIIPYRFQEGAYSDTDRANIEQWGNELSEYLGGCVKFINDTNEKKYSRDYLFVRAIDDDGKWISYYDCGQVAHEF